MAWTFDKGWPISEFLQLFVPRPFHVRSTLIPWCSFHVLSMLVPSLLHFFPHSFHVRSTFIPCYSSIFIPCSFQVFSMFFFPHSFYVCFTFISCLFHVLSMFGPRSFMIVPLSFFACSAFFPCLFHVTSMSVPRSFYIFVPRSFHVCSTLFPCSFHIHSMLVPRSFYVCSTFVCIWAFSWIVQTSYSYLSKSSSSIVIEINRSLMCWSIKLI